MFSRLCAILCAAAVLWQPGIAFAGAKIDFDQGVDVKQTLQTVKSADASGLPKVTPVGVESKDAKSGKGLADWTIMVFINGKNNLASYALKDVNEMEAVGSNERINVVVELATIKDGSKRYLAQKDDKPSAITSPVVQNLGKVDMGDYRHLVDFGNWAKANYPAKKTMLVVWNHGSGWNKKNGNEFSTRGISYDDETGNHITTIQLGEALAAIGGVDVYGSDACLMQMAEVAYQLKDYASVIVGSEETEPGDGWDYTGLLKRIAAAPDMGAEGAGQAVVDSYQAWYAGINQGSTQSMLRASALKDLVPAVGAWTSAVMAANETQVVKDARGKVQDFYYSDNIDLLHLVKLIQEGTKNEAVKAAGEKLMGMLQKQLIGGNGTSGSNYGNASGLAVYLPSYSVSSGYADLAWAKESNWDEFANWFVKL